MFKVPNGTGRKGRYGMKKIILVLIAITMATFICGCAKVVDEIPIDARFTESHQEIRTDYDYQVDILGEETFKLMPNIHTVTIPDKYEVQYRVYYDDSTNKTEWREVARDEYEAVLRILERTE